MVCKCIIQKGSDKVVKYTTIDSNQASKILNWHQPVNVRDAYSSILRKQFRGYEGYIIKKVSLRDSVEVPSGVRADMHVVRHSHGEVIKDYNVDIITGMNGEASIHPIEILTNRVETLKSLWVGDFTDKERYYTPWMNILIDLKDLLLYEIKTTSRDINACDAYLESLDKYVVNISRLLDVPQDIFSDQFCVYPSDSNSDILVIIFTVELFYEEEDM